MYKCCVIVIISNFNIITVPSLKKKTMYVIDGKHFKALLLKIHCCYFIIKSIVQII